MVNWGNAILVAVLGLGTVFAVLIIIMIALMIMTKIFAPKKKSEPKAAQVKTPAPAKEVEVKTQPENNDTELIAILAAAIAAYTDKPVSSLKIKSYRRLGEVKSSWANIARKENIYTRF